MFNSLAIAIADEEVDHAFMRHESINGMHIGKRKNMIYWKPSTTHRWTINVDDNIMDQESFGDATVIEAIAIVKAMK